MISEPLATIQQDTFVGLTFRMRNKLSHVCVLRLFMMNTFAYGKFSINRRHITTIYDLRYVRKVHSSYISFLFIRAWHVNIFSCIVSSQVTKLHCHLIRYLSLYLAKRRCRTLHLGLHLSILYYVVLQLLHITTPTCVTQNTHVEYYVVCVRKHSQIADTRDTCSPLFHFHICNFNCNTHRI
jgi:hypothetical protein